MNTEANITQLLLQWSHGDDTALDELTPLVYDHLHQMARRLMAGERPGHTLQATALVNEAYGRLIDSRRAAFRDRAHFFALAARLMRRILVDFARARGRDKRGGRETVISLEAGPLIAHPRASDPDLIDLDEVLVRLERMDQRKARVVEMRFFGGLDEKEIAETLGISTDTAQRDWKAARAWLYTQLTPAK